MSLTFIGAGFVGLVSAAVYADLGNDVNVIETNKNKLLQLEQNKIPFYEPGLQGLITKNVKKHRLFFTDDYSTISRSEIIFVCVGTPCIDGHCDLQSVNQSINQIAPHLKDNTIIAIKSTVPPGTNVILNASLQAQTQAVYAIASMPEFLREGKAIFDTRNPDRIIIGTTDKNVAKKLLLLVKPLGGTHFVCDPLSAQMIKYASNSFLATKISFANSIAVLCDKVGADTKKTMEAIGLDKRIGASFLGAGLGYGGSCFPKDVEALIDIAKQSGYQFDLLQATQSVNRFQITYYVNKLSQICGDSLKGKTITLLGLAFKPETSDMREACSIYLTQNLLEKGAIVRGCDPIALKEASTVIPQATLFIDPYLALKNADAAILVTEWPEYLNLDWKKVKSQMKTPIILDGRNALNPQKLTAAGFIYEGLGVKLNT